MSTRQALHSWARGHKNFRLLLASDLFVVGQAGSFCANQHERPARLVVFVLQDMLGAEYLKSSVC